MSVRGFAATLAAVCLAACARGDAGSSEKAIRQLWDEYLRSKNGRFATHAGTPSALWSAAERAKWPMYDLAGFYLPNGAVPEVVRVTPLKPAADGPHEIVTQFWPRGTVPGDTASRALFTITVIARRERGRWVLANALPQRTASWQRETRGRISYHIAPALSFDANKALRAAAFVDSLAAAFDVPPPQIDYYVAESVDQALTILGVESAERYGAAGGFAKPVNGQVFSGIPALGEDYRHEIAHVVLYPVLRDAATTLLASEGVPTWLGGTAGDDFRASVRKLDSALRAQPRVTLDAIVNGAPVASEIRNAAGGVLAQMVNDAGGAAAVRAFLRAGPGPAAFTAELERLLRQPWPTIVQEWRGQVTRLASR